MVFYMTNQIKSALLKSLKEQEHLFEEQLILNPVENVPTKSILTPCNGFLHGLYNTDSVRTNSQKINTKLQFSGRNQITKDISLIYKEWSTLLNAEALSMRLLSGLHAHIILFMSISLYGDRVLYLSEKAGGHTSGKAILERLGLCLEALPIDYKNCRVDVSETKSLIESFKPQFLFIDRSEGIIYEDFSWVKSIQKNIIKIFDASQYLTNIISEDYTNPFEMGFDIILSTLHKNLPGPQRALLCAKRDDDVWKKIKSGLSLYVSNMHVFTIYSAGLLLDEIEHLHALSKEMLCNAIQLESELSKRGIPVVNRIYNENEKPTHHIWIVCDTKEDAFNYYLRLEEIGILTNYRMLPYNIGYGLRIGLSAATQQGLRSEHIARLADIMSDVYNRRSLLQCKKDFQALLKEIKCHEE